MNEAELLTLIAQQEDTNIDFKRELQLEIARSKAELVKDIIAIANSESETGFLIVGVDDDKHIIGVPNMNEEQIQQIAYRYISPPVSINCELVPLPSLGNITIGVITIRSSRRPHKVASPIERLNQDEVYVRRGSITTKASPEEIIKMYGDQTHYQVNQLKRAADMHVKLKNYQVAIQSLSRAIEIKPEPDIFLERAKVYHQMRQVNRFNDLSDDWGEAGAKDIADAIAISKSYDFELQCRTIRRQFFLVASTNYDFAERVQDFNFIKNSLQGIARGKWIVEQVANEEAYTDSENGIVDLLHEAIELGYKETETYYWLARAYHDSYNFGLALEEFDKLFESSEEKNDFCIDILCWRAKILVEMKRYNQARETLIKARDIDSESFKQYVLINDNDLAREILCRCMLEKEFDVGDHGFINDIIDLVIVASTRTLRRLETSEDGREILISETDLDVLEEQVYKGIRKIVRKTIGEEKWKILTTGENDFDWIMRFPSMQSQIAVRKEKGFSFVFEGKRLYL